MEGADHMGPWMPPPRLPGCNYPISTPKRSSARCTTAPGDALEVTPAPKARLVCMGFANLWGHRPWRTRNTNASCTDAQCHLNPGRVSGPRWVSLTPEVCFFRCCAPTAISTPSALRSREVILNVGRKAQKVHRRTCKPLQRGREGHPCSRRQHAA